MATIDTRLADRLIGELTHDLDEHYGRLGKVKRYVAGQHDLPYIPRNARAEYRALAEKSITNWLGLVSDTFVKGLYVDGYRAPRAGDNSPAWEWWQANGLDARQSIAHRGAVDYGTSYAYALPGKGGVPVMRCLSPLKSAAWYADDDDEFPEIGLHRKGRSVDGTTLYEIFDARSVYTFGQSSQGTRLIRVDDHPLGVTPFVRFRDRLDGENVGLIRPLITSQDRINDIVFATLMALQYASHRQRWATGLAVPEDEDGTPHEPFSAAVDRLWVTDAEGAKFGEFAQTDTSGHARLYSDNVKTLAAQAQISPNVLTGDLVNLSADALAQMERSTQTKLEEFETLFGESWESLFRLAGRAQGDAALAGDNGAQVRWRDTEARSLSATVDALGKQAQMLGIPVEGLWEKIPGVTDQDVAYWRSLKAADPLNSLVAEFDRQSAPGPDTAPAGEASAA